MNHPYRESAGQAESANRMDNIAVDEPSKIAKAIAQMTYERESLSKTLGQLAARLEQALLPGGGECKAQGSDHPMPSESTLLRKINVEAFQLSELNAAISDIMKRLQP